jgi:hypothetical protein
MKALPARKAKANPEKIDRLFKKSADPFCLDSR